MYDARIPYIHPEPSLPASHAVMVIASLGMGNGRRLPPLRAQVKLLGLATSTSRTVMEDDLDSMGLAEFPGAPCVDFARLLIYCARAGTTISSIMFELTASCTYNLHCRTCELSRGEVRSVRNKPDCSRVCE